jgi:hypothetical protein
MNPINTTCYWSNRNWHCVDDISLYIANKKAVEMYGENKYTYMTLHPNQLPLKNTKITLYHPKYSYEHIQPLNL